MTCGMCALLSLLGKLNGDANRLERTVYRALRLDGYGLARLERRNLNVLRPLFALVSPGSKKPGLSGDTELHLVFIVYCDR